MILFVIVCLVASFIAGVGESARIIRELHTIAAELHARIASLEAAVKAKL